MSHRADPVAEPSRAYGRTGRDLPVATGVGVGLVVVLAGSLFVNPAIFAALAAVVALLATRELSAALVVGLSRRVSALVQIWAAGIVIAAYLKGSNGLLAATSGALLTVMVLRMTDGQKSYVRHVSRLAFILIYAPFLIGFAAMMAAQHDGAWRVMSFVLITAAADTGAYFTGVYFGKRLLAPQISPKKTWEGLAGAAALSAIVASILFTSVLHSQASVGIGVALALTVTGTCGDLIESILKRDLGMKDMSAMVPGHGGIMDRIDSLAVNAAVAWVLFSAILGF